MKSRISFFNRGVSRNLLHRCWPLWAGYFVLLLSVLPVALARTPAWYGNLEAGYQDRLVLQSGVGMVLVSFVMGILAVMLMFGYLYNSRSCCMMNALPIRRETMFGTAYLTGLVPMLAADLLAAGVTAALYAGRSVSISNLLLWLLMAVCANLSFYGIAVFCAMLTGSLLILPVVYVVLNLTAWVAENCLRAILGVLVYGINARQNLWLLWLSPVAKLHTSLYPGYVRDGGPWELFGLGWLLAYAAAGLLLSALALLLYRKRNMETATDTVAFPVLKPLFRYCMAFGTAIVFASVVYSLLLGGSFHGSTAALLILALLLLGAVLGWYVAEMLIRKTVRVFPGKWKGLLAVCAALALFMGVAELDVTGFERRIPAADAVKSVTVSYNGKQIVSQPENIEKTVALHQNVVDHKAQHEPDIHGYGRWLNLRYELKNGKSLERTYYLKAENVSDPTDVLLWEELMNCPELMDQRSVLRMPVTEETLYAAQLTCFWVDETGREQYDGVNLTTEEALDFYTQAILPDQRAHTLGRVWLLNDERRLNTVSNVSFYMDLRQLSGGDARLGTQPKEDWGYYSAEICMDSEACIRWLREHTELPVMSLRDAQADQPYRSTVRGIG